MAIWFISFCLIASNAISPLSNSTMESIPVYTNQIIHLPNNVGTIHIDNVFDQRNLPPEERTEWSVSTQIQMTITKQSKTYKLTLYSWDNRPEKNHAKEAFDIFQIELISTQPPQLAISQLDDSSAEIFVEMHIPIKIGDIILSWEGNTYESTANSGDHSNLVEFLIKKPDGNKFKQTLLYPEERNIIVGDKILSLEGVHDKDLLISIRSTKAQ